MSSSSLNQTALPLRQPSASSSSSSSAPSTQIIPGAASSSSSDSLLSNGPLDASRDARQIVRLVQCPQCSHPLVDPTTLPCGNSLCKKCIPPTHLRPHISYLASADRSRGFICPFLDCGREHVVADCSVDVALNKITTLVRGEMHQFRETPEASGVVLKVEEKNKWSAAGVGSLSGDGSPHWILPGGRLAATYTMAEMGGLAYDAEVTYTAISPISEDAAVLDAAFLDHLKEATRCELDCYVCYALFLDPLTTGCGHTYCRKCAHRMLDHSNLCPMCRRPLTLTPQVSAQAAPSNILLTKLLTGLCPEALAARAEADRADISPGMGELDLPLFICTLSFPSMPTFLHVFEPRYRLMIRRAVEHGDRKFGMVLSNPSGDPQGNLGRVPFRQYGTLLQVVNMHSMPDGRSIIETRGISRFRILRHGMLDGYVVGQVERVDDITLAEEEELEASERALSAPEVPVLPPSSSPNSQAPLTDSPPQLRSHTRAASASAATVPPPLPVDYNTISTQELMAICRSFVMRMREQSKSWLQTRVIQAYGECPTDPALFPWWFASVLPIGDAQKYRLLGTRSVRERLRICAVWIEDIEKQSWYVSVSSECS